MSVFASAKVPPEKKSGFVCKQLTNTAAYVPAITSGMFLSAGECILPKVYTRLAAHWPAADHLWHHSAASTNGSQRWGCNTG